MLTAADSIAWHRAGDKTCCDGGRELAAAVLEHLHPRGFVVAAGFTRRAVTIAAGPGIAARDAGPMRSAISGLYDDGAG